MIFIVGGSFMSGDVGGCGEVGWNSPDRSHPTESGAAQLGRQRRCRPLIQRHYLRVQTEREVDAGRVNVLLLRSFGGHRLRSAQVAAEGRGRPVGAVMLSL